MRCHQPQKLPIKVNYDSLALLMSQANYTVGELKGLQKSLKNPLLLIAPLTTKEATVSSKIEGTQSTVKDVYMHEAGGITKHSDVIEVSNYKKAMYHAMEELSKRPISLNLIKTVHNILLTDTRGNASRGEFRKEPVWIGVPNSPIEQATYVPPSWEKVPDYMANLESYFHFDNEDALVQAALIHYQFEAIHPFYDGNGRIGRLLIPLFLFSRRRLNLPILYLSGFFDAEKDKYLEALHSVDQSGVYDPWVAYFLRAVIAQAQATGELINKIISLHDELLERTVQLKSPYMVRLIDFMFKQPVFKINQAADELKAHGATIIRLLRELDRLGYIVEVSGLKKGKIFIFKQLVSLL